MAAGCRWAARTSGATSSTASSWAAGSTAPAVRPDHAADHHGLRRRRWARPPAGAVWLNADRLSPFDYWQFWRNTEDADVGRFLRLFTELPLDEIARLEKLGGRRASTRPRRSWPIEATTLAMARAAARRRPRPPRARAFEQGAALPRACRRGGRRRTTWRAGIPVIELLFLAGLAASNGRGPPPDPGGGARLNDEAIADEARAVTAGDLTPTACSSCPPARSGTCWSRWGNGRGKMERWKGGVTAPA